MAVAAAFVVAVLAVVATAQILPIDKAGIDQVRLLWPGRYGAAYNRFTPLARRWYEKVFDGIGGLSGGGATTRLLVDYPRRAAFIAFWVTADQDNGMTPLCSASAERHPRLPVQAKLRRQPAHPESGNRGTALLPGARCPLPPASDGRRQGDSQSTDGTESSHMHTPDTVDYHTGYEWWLMSEAKKRNPDIKLVRSGTR